MVKKSDHTKMVELGEWLELFLEDEVTHWRFKELARKAIRYLDLDFQLEDSDLTLQCISRIEKQSPDIREKYNDLASHQDDFPSEEDILGIDEDGEEDRYGIKKCISEPVELFNEKYHAAIKHLFEVATRVTGKSDSELWQILYDSDRYNQLAAENKELSVAVKNWEKLSSIKSTLGDFDWEEEAIDCLMDVYALRPLVFSLLSEIHKSNLPWPYYIEKVVKQEDPRMVFVERTFSVVGFWGCYSDVSDRFDIKDGKVKKVRTFTTTFPDILMAHLPTVFPWPKVVSRIFFDFLMLGGQDYINFCRHCGRFNVSQRKGRKKFCSDKCRLDHFRS